MASSSRTFVATRFAVMATCLVLTALAAAGVSQYQGRHSAEFFHNLTEDNLEALGARLHAIEVAVDGAAGLIQTSAEITPQDWTDFVTALDIDRKLPTIGGIGWVASVSKADGSYARLNRQLRARGYEIHPPSDREETLIVQYLSPEAPNAAAIGLDVLSQPTQVRSVQRAIDSGQSTLSEPFQLVQHPLGDLGFVLFRSFEGRSSGAPEPVLHGLAYAFFRAKDIFAGLSASQGRYLELEVYGGSEVTPDARLYESATVPSDAAYERTETVDFYGQPLTFRWKNTPEFVLAQTSFLPWYIGVSGLFLAGLIGLNTLTHARRTRAIEHAIEDQTRELKASADRTAAVIDNAVVGISVHDARGRILSANPALLELFETDEKETIGAWVCDFAPGIPTKPWEGTIFLDTLTKSGKKLCLKVQVNEWRNKAGESRYVLLFDDVSAEQAITDRLREAEHRLNLALNAAEIGIYDIDVKTGQGVVSDSWVALMGLDRETMSPNPQDDFFARVHPDDLPIVLAAEQECIDGIASRSICEYRVEVAPGEWRWMRSNTSIAETDSAGNVTRLIGSQNDFTDLYKAHASLRESRRQFLSVLEHSPVPLALLDSDGRFTRVNEALAELSGYSRDELLGIDFQARIHPEDLKDILRAIEQLRTGAVPVIKVEGRIVHRGGHPIWILLSVSRARDSVTGSDLFIAQFVDISQRKETERTNREFFANMSHELRTPLTSVKGAIDLVMGTARDKLPENVVTLLGIAQGNSDRLARLLNDLLDLEKVSTNRMRFHYARHNLVDVVSKAVVAAAPIAETRKVRFETALPQDGVFAWTDAVRLEQVLLNLLSNAVKYSEDGQTVTISLHETESDMVVSVRDCGSGIPESYRSMVFQPFSQADSSATRKRGGTGLGLSIAKSLIEHMGGRIDFESAPQAGTVFNVRLPKGLTGAQMARANDVPPARVLHLETDTAFSDLLGHWLGPAHMLVNVATLEQARTELERRCFHAIVVNWDALAPGDEPRLRRLKVNHPQLCVVGLASDVPATLASFVDLELARDKMPMDAIARKCLRQLRETAGSGAEV